MPEMLLKLADASDRQLALDIDDMKREKKIEKAIANKECYLITKDDILIGFVICNYNFFDLWFIDLLIIRVEYRGKGYGYQALSEICKLCSTKKIFTSTNESNDHMRELLKKSDFAFAGQLNGLDEGDPELFYYKVLTCG